jgi:hypothetical protein
MLGLSVERGIHVDAPREQQAVEAVEQGLRVLGRERRQHHGHGARAFHRADVVGAHRVVARPVAVPERDPDDRARHIRSGIGIPSSSSSTSIWRTNASTTSARLARRSSLAACNSECWGFW